MIRKGMMELPLHDGKAPTWLTKRMKEMASCISSIIIDEYGSKRFLERLSDPLWFQAFGCVLGYDWHSSGVTTVVTGVLKEVMKEEVMIAGGKGKKSRDTPSEITRICDHFNISESKKDEMIYASRMAAKVDNILLQDNYTLYHHTFIISEDGLWAVIQQGMDQSSKRARRYHWLSSRDLINEPRSGIISSDVREHVLDLTSRDSEECRDVCVDIVNDHPDNTISSIYKLRSDTLDRWIYGFEAYGMPRRLDWSIFKRIYDIHPKSYEELIAIKGVGSNTVRALALIAEIIYGSRASWKDPVKFTFAHGGKDGVPYPVDRELYDKNISILKDAIEGAEIDRQRKLDAIKRLRTFYP